MDINDLRAAITLLAFVAFIGIVYWAYRGRSRRGFEEAARLPFADDTQPPAAEASGRGAGEKTAGDER